MTRRRSALVVAGALAALPVAASAAGAADARALLTQAFAGPTRPFGGEQVSVVAVESGSVRSVVHFHSDGKGRVRREYRSGPAEGVVLLEAGRAVWQYAPGVGWSRLPDTAAANAAAAAAMTLANYNVTVASPAKLLGLRVYPVRIAARRAFDPSRRLWLDPTTGVLLRDELYAPDGRLRSSTTVTAIRFGPQSEAEFRPPSNAAETESFGPGSFRPAASRAAMERATGWTAPAPGHVPAGYRPVLYGIMTAGSGRQLPAVRYSNGIGAFTIFRRGAGPGGGMGRGAGRGMGRGRGGGRGMGGPSPGAHGLRGDVQRAVVEARGREGNYLLIGDIAEDELRRVAASLA
ncbi:MAG: hypothetical protein IT208_17370 [Chthonomonadales bacterium]|nr:hypothetical protein [Chthonomonadales bacterium]